MTINNDNRIRHDAVCALQNDERAEGNETATRTTELDGFLATCVQQSKSA